MSSWYGLSHAVTGFRRGQRQARADIAEEGDRKRRQEREDFAFGRAKIGAEREDLEYPQRKRRLDLETEGLEREGEFGRETQKGRIASTQATQESEIASAPARARSTVATAGLHEARAKQGAVEAEEYVAPEAAAQRAEGRRLDVESKRVNVEGQKLKNQGARTRHESGRLALEAERETRKLFMEVFNATRDVNKQSQITELNAKANQNAAKIVLQYWKIDPTGQAAAQAMNQVPSLKIDDAASMDPEARKQGILRPLNKAGEPYIFDGKPFEITEQGLADFAAGGTAEESFGTGDVGTLQFLERALGSKEKAVAAWTRVKQGNSTPEQEAREVYRDMKNNRRSDKEATEAYETALSVFSSGQAAAPQAAPQPPAPRGTPGDAIWDAKLKRYVLIRPGADGKPQRIKLPPHAAAE